MVALTATYYLRDKFTCDFSGRDSETIGTASQNVIPAVFLSYFYFIFLFNSWRICRVFGVGGTGYKEITGLLCFLVNSGPILPELRSFVSSITLKTRTSKLNNRLAHYTIIAIRQLKQYDVQCDFISLLKLTTQQQR